MTIGTPWARLLGSLRADGWFLVPLGVHARYGFSSVRLKSIGAAGAVFGPVGYEINLLYIAALIALALGGSTPLSLERWLEERRKKQWTPPTR